MPHRVPTMFRSLTTTTTAGFLLLPLTVPEVGRLPWALVGQKVPSPAALYCPYGADDTSDAPGALMGSGEPTNRVVNPGCSTTADRRLVGTKVATMAEETCGILSGDAVESGTERLLECLDRARSDAAQI